MSPLREAMFRGAYRCARVIDEYGQTCDARSTLYAWAIDVFGEVSGNEEAIARSGPAYEAMIEPLREAEQEAWLREEESELMLLFCDALYWEVFGRREAERDRRLA